MTPAAQFTRREILKAAALGAVTLPLFGSAAGAAEKKSKGRDAGGEKAAPAAEPLSSPSPDGREHGLRLGVATYSLRTVTADEAIATLKVLRIVNAGVFRNHIPWGGTVDEVRAAAAKFQAAGLAITGSGVIQLPNDEAELRKAFENAKAAGLQTMVCKPAKVALPLVEKFAREYDQKLAIHNHGPEDKDYPTSKEAWDVIRSLDSRIGLCVDVGHTARTGEDPAVHIRRYASRVYDIHMKDSVAIVGAQRDVPVEVGAGRLDIPGMLKALLDIKYNGVVSFEYEKVAGNPVTGLAESVGYVRGILAAFASRR
jgi:inosose dehydratase